MPSVLDLIINKMLHLFALLIDCFLTNLSCTVLLLVVLLIAAILCLNFALTYPNPVKLPTLFNELHKATFDNDVIKVIRLLQQDSSEINQLHPLDGYSVFMRACLHGNTQLVNIMLKYGADVSLKSSKGETPFYLAIFYHIQNPKIMDATCIRALYYAGSDVNATNLKGCGPIHLAANFGHTNLVKWLIAKGASTAVEPYPYLIARMQGHNETALLLRNVELPAIE